MSTTSTSDGVFQDKVAPHIPAVATPPVVEAPKPAAPVVAPVAAQPTVPPIAAEPAEGQDPPWLAARLQRAQNKVLRDLGVEPSKMNDAKEALAAYQAKLEKDKSDLDKANERAKLVPELTTERDRLHAIVSSHAAIELGKLTAEQKSAVLAISGDDPEKQLTNVNALRPTWVAPAPPIPAAAQETKVDVAAPQPKPPIPPPAATAPPPGSPGSAPPANPATHLEVMRELEKTNPIKAAQYYDRFKIIINGQVAAEQATKQSA